MPAGGFGGGSRGGNRTKQMKTKTLDKNALRKQEEEADKQPSAHAAKVQSKKALAREKAKARKNDPDVLARKAESAANRGKAPGGGVAGSTAAATLKEAELKWVDDEGNLEIHGKL